MRQSRWVDLRLENRAVARDSHHLIIKLLLLFQPTLHFLSETTKNKEKQRLTVFLFTVKKDGRFIYPKPTKVRRSTMTSLTLRTDQYGFIWEGLPSPVSGLINEYINDGPIDPSPYLQPLIFMTSLTFVNQLKSDTRRRSEPASWQRVGSTASDKAASSPPLRRCKFFTVTRPYSREPPRAIGRFRTKNNEAEFSPRCRVVIVSGD